uniref:Hyaluronan/mRNA-binding protein domain-containing protein n=1 Tax=Panagrolaimus superbus TaxID=310955 RepID=A0A914YGF1_9BILA
MVNAVNQEKKQQDGEVGHVREDDEKLNVDRRPNRGDRGNRRPYRGGAGRGGGGRSDRTGVHDAPKKDGYGKGNWGTEKDELQGETEPTGETNVVKPTEEDNAEKNDSGVELEKEEEKPVGMTLQEWKEKNKAIEPETFNVRKPNDDKKLNLAPLKKSEDENKENDEFVVLRREPREKHVDISVNFASTTDRGVGGNRDGFRGRGGDRQDRERGDRQTRATKGGQRGDRNRGSNNSQFNLLNDQFPVLGGH